MAALFLLLYHSLDLTLKHDSVRARTACLVYRTPTGPIMCLKTEHSGNRERNFSAWIYSYKRRKCWGSER